MIDDREPIAAGDYRYYTAPAAMTDRNELAAIKRITNQYREFDAVYDPECQLPPLAQQVHDDYIELLNRVDALKSQIKIRDAAKS